VWTELQTIPAKEQIVEKPFRGYLLNNECSIFYGYTFGKVGEPLAF
jgi:hypothetical protein